MQYSVNSIQNYIDQLPENRQGIMEKLIDVIQNNIPQGFECTVSYGHIGFVIPHSIYPKGYHCDPKLPLPFVNIASQKNHIAIYHMGIYMNQEVFDWFVNEFPKHSSKKLDMGKSCIRFKKAEDIPLDLIGELMTKIEMADYINTYESLLNKK